jgi:hypothetical protein
MEDRFENWNFVDETFPMSGQLSQNTILNNMPYVLWCRENEATPYLLSSLQYKVCAPGTPVRF